MWTRIAKFSLSSIVVLALAHMPSVAQAAIVKYQLGGVITDLSQVYTPIPGIALGAEWQVEAIYSGALSGHGGATTAYKSFALLSYTFSISPSFTYTVLPATVGSRQQTVSLNVADSTLGNSLEFIARNSETAGSGHALPLTPLMTIDGRKLWNSFVSLGDPTGALWEDNLLSNSFDFGLDDFSSKRFVMNFITDTVSPNLFETVFGDVRSYRVTLVPVPGGLLLFGSALALLGGHSRRCSRRAR